MINLDTGFCVCPNLHPAVSYENKEDIFLMHERTTSCLTLLFG